MGTWMDMGDRFKERFHLPAQEVPEPEYTTAPHGTCRVQVVRSVCDWSHGVLTEHSIQNACKLTWEC
jgi:phospholipase D1/2